MSRRLASLVVALAVVALPGCDAAQAQVGEYGQQQRGRELVTLGDCAGCHSGPNGMMAGGLPIKTPFGVIYSANITPDAQTGIGAWSDDQFYRAMHEGIDAEGNHLYPAFPYPWFTKVTRQDVVDIRAYLRSIPPVKYRPPDNKLPWPLDDRAAMIGWNALYFKAGTFQPDAGKSPEWNRGAYLVQGLAHCGACHTPSNLFGAAEQGKHLQGGELQNWFAPSLAGDTRTGLGDWSEQDIVQFLKTGHTERAVAYGPMTKVVEDSTSQISDADRRAIAVYLKSLPGTGTRETPSRPAPELFDAGQAIYTDSCSACHQQHGEGVPGLFPALKGAAVVQSDKATTVIRLILNGGRAAVTTEAPTGQAMPAFDWKLSDPQIAAVASFVRNAWGNVAAPVSSSDVRDVRSAVQNVSSAD